MGVQNEKTRPDPLGKGENAFGSAKRENGADALGKDENASGSEKRITGARRTR